MSLMKLTTEELLSISTLWLEDLRDDFLAIPEIAGLLPLVQRAHDQLREVLEEVDDNAELEEASALADAIDDRHDATVRVVWERLKAQEDYYTSLDPPDLDSARAVGRVRRRLLPEGLTLIDLPYWKEAVFAAELEERMDASTQQILERIPVTADVSLRDVVQQWSQLGRALGNLESAKVASVMKRRKHWRSSRIQWLELTETIFTVLHQVQSDPKAAARLRRPYLDGIGIAREREALPEEV